MKSPSQHNPAGRYSHVPRKRFGQHFLHDPQVIGRILQALAGKSGECIVEIGPGLGALTAPLLEKTGELHVVEIDRDVIPALEALCRGKGQLHVHQADALRFDFRQLAQGRRLRLVGNLPYNISTPLLFHLLAQADGIQDMLFMLQQEVVDRMVAGTGDDAYGRLSVSLAARAEVSALFSVGRGAFHPPPKVESAVVYIKPRPAPFAIADLHNFDAVVTRAFAQRRKMLGNALDGLIDRESIRGCGIDPSLRAERISPGEYATLSNLLPPAEHRQPADS